MSTAKHNLTADNELERANSSRKIMRSVLRKASSSVNSARNLFTSQIAKVTPRPSLGKRGSSFFEKLKKLIERDRQYQETGIIGTFDDDPTLSVEQLMKRYGITEEEMEQYTEKIRKESQDIKP